MDNVKYLFALLFITTLLSSGCSKAPELERTQPRNKITLKGTFITESPDEINFPIKVLFAVDCSLSMGDAARDDIEGGSDPHYLRLEAVRNFVDQYNSNENVSFEIMLWNLNITDTTRVITSTGENIPGFTKDPVEINRVLDNAFVDSMTDYIGTLDAIYRDIEQDIMDAEDADNLIRSKYIVIFLSDGMSNVGNGPQSDLDIWQRVDDLNEMITERGVGGFNFHTFLLTELFGPDADSQYVQGLAEATLRGMASRGNGQFRLFETAESIDFLNIIDMRLSVEYRVKYMVVYNYNVRPGMELIYVDNDGDGLTNNEEREYGTDINVIDTDNDGLSDFFERKVSSPGHELDPLAQDSPCDIRADGLWPDSDVDGLTDCEEFVKGTNRFEVDTDKDGIPDGIEFLMGTNPLEIEYTTDSDFDGIENWQEIQHHTNVNSNDPIVRKKYSYQYHFQDEGLIPIDQGSSMESYVRKYNFTVSNIDIMKGERETADGNIMLIDDTDNLIRFYIAETPEDRPEISPIFRVAEVLINMNAKEQTIILTPGDFILLH